MPPKILISAGEASGDLYGAALAENLLLRRPDAQVAGCAGHRMQAAGVKPVVDASSLSVVGLVEVVAHIPRIYGEYRKMVSFAASWKPDVAVLIDSPDFHLRLAKRLKKLGIPVVYLVAPQVWAWRKGRIHALRRNLDRLLCIFPFEEEYFRRERIRAEYIGHPLARIVRPSLSREEFFRKHRIPGDRPLIAVLPGSRSGEIARHLPALASAVEEIGRRTAATFALAIPAGFSARNDASFFAGRTGSGPVEVIEGETWDVIGHADLALAASGTVTVEAALLGTPMVTFYKVTPVSWALGKLLVDVPHYTMVNLVAGRRVVPELMQNEMTGTRIAAEALRLLESPGALQAMRSDLAGVAASLGGRRDPIGHAAGIVEEYFSRE